MALGVVGRIWCTNRSVIKQNVGIMVWGVSCSITSDSLQPHGLEPGSTVHGILQARILEWVAILFSRVSSRSRDQTRVSWIAGRFFTVWATREALSWYTQLYYNAFFEKANLGTSQVVQQWRVHLAMQGDMGSFPSQGIETPQAIEQLSLCAANIETSSHN